MPSFEFDTRLIRKYKNRKLYDTVEHKYVSLNHIYNLIRNGTNVKIEDVTINQDITGEVLIQAVLETEKSQFANAGTLLTSVMRSGNGTLIDFLRTKFNGGL